MWIAFLKREVNVYTSSYGLNCSAILSMIDKVSQTGQELGMPFEYVELFLLKWLYYSVSLVLSKFGSLDKPGSSQEAGERGR